MDEQPISINEQAPVVGAREVEIAARPDLVWEVLTELERWPSWNLDVKSLAMQGPLAVGSEVRWRTASGTITSTIRRVEPPRLFAWTGRMLGVRTIHFCWLEPRGGTTLVRTEESFDGVVARLFRRSLQKTLDSRLGNSLRYLKAEAERRTTRLAYTASP